MTNVELTKVHYYSSTKRQRNFEIPTVSQEVFDNDFNKRVFIKRNVLGHRWVLRINESGEDVVKEGSRWRILAYVVVFCFILTAVGLGVYVSLIESYMSENPAEGLKNETQVVPIRTERITVHDAITVEAILNRLHTDRENTTDGGEKHTTQIQITHQSKKSICNCATRNEVCLKLDASGPPRCMPGVDPKDPSGCGGLCAINTQFCRVLDKTRRIHECVDNADTLRCPEGQHSCGDMCVSSSKRCDGVAHCRDLSDERRCECDLETHFRCGNETSCLEKKRRCDGKVDCWDSSDEMDCAESCHEGQVPCDSSTECIPKSKICDGNFDCKDRSDEPLFCRPISIS